MVFQQPARLQLHCYTVTGDAWGSLNTAYIPRNTARFVKLDIYSLELNRRTDAEKV